MMTLTKEDSYQIFLRAAETGDTTLLADLLRQNIDVNATNVHGMTALMRAAAAGRIQMVQLLLEHGADPNISRNDGFTPLMLAAFFGHTDIVKILVQHGADTSAAARSGTSARMWAAARTCKDVLEYLQKPDKPIQSVRYQIPIETQSGLARFSEDVTGNMQPRLLRRGLIGVSALSILFAIGVTATGLKWLGGVSNASRSGVTQRARKVINESLPREDSSGSSHEPEQKKDSNIQEAQSNSNTRLMPLRRIVTANYRSGTKSKEQSIRNESSLTPRPVMTDTGIMATHIVPVKPVPNRAKLAAPTSTLLMSPAKSSSKPGKVIAWP